MSRLFHREAGDGDHLFVLAEDKEDALNKVDAQGEFTRDMVTSVVEHPYIVACVRSETLKAVGEHLTDLVLTLPYSEDKLEEYCNLSARLGKAIERFNQGEMLE